MFCDTLTTIYYSATRHRSASAFSRAAATPRISSLLQNANRTKGLEGPSVKKGDAGMATTPCSAASHRQKAQSAATEPSLYSSGMSSSKLDTSPTTKYPPCDGSGSTHAALNASASTLRLRA